MPRLKKEKDMLARFHFKVLKLHIPKPNISQHLNKSANFVLLNSLAKVELLGSSRVLHWTGV